MFCFLSTYCVKHINHIADIALEYVDKTGNRSLHAADNLRNKFVAARQVCQSVDGCCIDDLTVGNTDFDRQSFCFRFFDEFF